MKFHIKRICVMLMSLLVMFIFIDQLLMSSQESPFTKMELDNLLEGTNLLYLSLFENYKQYIRRHEFKQMLPQLHLLNNKVVDQKDKSLVQIIRDFWMFKPSLDDYTLKNSNKSDFSMGQAPIVDRLLNKKERGFFVECGALDGETRSNSLFFERERYWEGIIVEASIPNFIQLMEKHRKAYAVPACLGINAYPETMKFNEASNRGRLIDSREAYNWIEERDIEWSLSRVQCFPLYSILLALAKTHIDYLSLDVEGVELNVLKTIPWDEVDISGITVEFLHVTEGKEALKDFLQSKGYKLVDVVIADRNLANDFVFIKKSLVQNL